MEQNNTPGNHKESAEKLLESAFTDLLAIAQREGVTVKRMRELLSRAQVRAMRQQGMSQQEIMGASGYSLKTIRRLLQEGGVEDRTDLVTRFVGDWSSDPHFPDQLALGEQQFPNFIELCTRYAGDFTPPSLLQILLSRGLVQVEGGQVELLSKALTPSPGHEMLEYASFSIHCLLSTLDHNLSGQRPGRMERRLWSHRLPRSQLAILRERVKLQVEQLRRQVLAEIDALEQRSGAEPLVDELLSAGLGLYWFELEE